MDEPLQSEDSSMTSSSDREPEGRGALRKALVMAAVVLSVPLGILAALVWALVGWLCSSPFLTRAAVAWALLLALFLPWGVADGTSFSFTDGILDAVLVMAATTLLYTVVAARPRERRRAFLAVPTLVCIYLVAKMAAIGGGGEAWQMAWLLVSLPLAVTLYVSAANAWRDVSLKQLEEAEAALLKGYCQVPVKQTTVAGLGTLMIEEQWQGDAHARKPVLVLVHGYAAGNAFWMFNLSDLSRSFRVLCVELYGCGRSERRPFHATKPEDAEVIFVSALERWRSSWGLGQFILCGHSLGGMVSSAYSMAYPKRIQKLVLLSPVGVAHRPQTLSEAQKSRRSTRTYRLYTYLWNHGFTPCTPVRFAGPFGHRLVATVYRKRMSWVPPGAKIFEVDPEDMTMYMYQNWALPASGEKALGAMLTPEVYAHKPLVESLAAGEAGLSAPVTIIYGAPDHDWMERSHGDKLAEKLVSQGGQAAVVSVPNSSHLLIVDNPEGTNRAVTEAIYKAIGAHWSPPITHGKQQVTSSASNGSAAAATATAGAATAAAHADGVCEAAAGGGSGGLPVGGVMRDPEGQI